MVELECIEVCTLLFHNLLDFSDAICCYRYLRRIHFLRILPCTPCTSLKPTVPALPPFRRPNNCHFESGRLPGIYYTDYGLTLSVQDSSVVMRICLAYVRLLIVECSILAGAYLLFCSLIHERGYCSKCEILFVTRRLTFYIY